MRRVKAVAGRLAVVWVDVLMQDLTPLRVKQSGCRFADFLSIYALTKTDGVTDDLKENIVNMTAADLFGNMISGVIIGAILSKERLTGTAIYDRPDYGEANTRNGDAKPISQHQRDSEETWT